MKTWRKMEELVDLGLTRGISATSNMTTPAGAGAAPTARIKPAVNEMELHPHFQQPRLFQFGDGERMQPIGFQPHRFARPPGGAIRTPQDTAPSEDSVIVKIAARHQIHPAVVCIQWAVKRGQTPIPFSVNPRNYLPICGELWAIR